MATVIEHITEETMIDCCSRKWDNNYYKFRNFFYRRDHEADLFVISKSRFATEVEIKLTIADWRADAKKFKHQSHKYVKYFYYAVPEELITKSPDDIDPRYGLISVRHGDDGDLHAWFIKKAMAIPADKIPKNMIARAFLSAYYKSFEINGLNRYLRKRVRELLEKEHVCA